MPNTSNYFSIIFRWAVLCLLSAHSVVSANPQGGNVTQGNASITTNASNVTIKQTTDKAVINWQSFSINEFEITRFEQPRASSVTLNRIIGGDPSRILGKLQANGNIFLVNPNGIVFGQNSRIDVNGLVATTYDITDDNFMRGNYEFNLSGKADASIVNLGTITIKEAGIAAFVAPAVRNDGVIQAQLGKVALASGTGFSLDLYGDELFKLKVDPQTMQAYTVDGEPLYALVENNGSIEAQTVIMTANAVRDVVDTVINMDGYIHATDFAQNGGEIIIGGAQASSVQITGTLDAASSTGQGGDITVTADQIILSENTVFDTSGATGGGQILIGGDWQGSGDLYQATKVLVTENVTLDASAIDNGDGGKIVIWSDISSPDSVTAVYGTLSASGGANGGDGGQIETSGHYLSLSGIKVDASAANGQKGLWLLDPPDLTVSLAVSDIVPFPAPPADLYDASFGSVVSVGDITAALDRNTDVSLLSGAGGSIILTADIFTTGNATLLMAADNDIFINSNIISTGSLSLNLFAGQNISLAAGVTVNTGGGDILMSAGDGRFAGDATGGDISIDPSASLILGANAAFYTGSIAGSTGLDLLSASFSYNTDVFTPPGGGIEVFYREVLPTTTPTTAPATDASKAFEPPATPTVQTTTGSDSDLYAIDTQDSTEQGGDVKNNGDKESLTPQQILNLTDDQVRQLSPQQIASLSTAAIHAMRSDQFALLNQKQVNALSVSQIQQMSFDQIAAMIPSGFISVNQDQIARLLPEGKQSLLRLAAVAGKYNSAKPMQSSQALEFANELGAFVQLLQKSDLLNKQTAVLPWDPYLASLKNGRWPLFPSMQHQNYRVGLFDWVENPLEQLGKDIGAYFAKQNVDEIFTAASLSMIKEYVGDSDAVQALIDATPVVGNLLTLYTAITGEDPYTGEEVDGLERTLAILGTVPGAGALIKIAGKNDLDALQAMLESRTSELLGKGRDATEFALELINSFQSIDIEAIDENDEIHIIAYDLIKDYLGISS